MKSNFKYICSVGAFALILGSAISCSEEEPIYMPPTFKLNEVLDVMRTTARFSGSISGDVSKVKEYGFEYSTTEEFTSSTTQQVIVGDSAVSSSYDAEIRNLEAKKTYHYRMYASTGASKVYSEAKYFQTAASSAPLLSEIVVDSIGENLARFRCTVEDIGDEYLVEYGIEYKSKTDQAYIPISSDSILSGSATSSPVTYFVEINNLEPATAYTFRPYAANSVSKDGKSTQRNVGEDIEERTKEMLSADITTMEPTAGINSIDVSGIFNGAAGSEDVINSCGFCWSETNLTPLITDETLTLDPVRAGETFRDTITDLKPKTLYYVRAFASNTVEGKERFSYGEVYSVTTGGLKKPTLVFEEEENEWGGIYTVYETTASTIRIKATITNYDANALVEKGLIWSGTDGDITLEQAKANGTVLSLDLNIGGKTIDGTIQNLEMDHPYHVRAYAVYRADNLEEVGYTNTEFIHTDNFETPNLVSAEIQDITRNSATLVGGMHSKGNGTIKEKGFVISKYDDTYRPELTTEGVIIVKSDDETFTEEVKGLEYSTLYAVRTYAIAELAEEKDTVYSGNTNMWTNSLNGPDFKPFNAELSSDTLSVSTGLDEVGDGVITERGFFWRLDTVSTDFILSNSENYILGTGDNDKFSAIITGLRYNKGYNVGTYVKSFVDGDTILYYGSSTHKYINFNGPDVDITEAYSEGNTLICSGIVRSLGDGKIVERGFLWKKYGDDVEFNLENCAHAKAEGDDEKFTYTITGLDFNTTYSVRSYVKSLAGKDTITTLQGGYWNPGTGGVRTPNMGGLEHVSATLSSITVKSSIENPGIGQITEKGFIWIKNPEDGNWKYPTFDEDDPNDPHNDGYTGYKAVTDGTNEEFSLEITGLDKNTHYFISAYAKMVYEDKEYISYSGTGNWSTEDYNMPYFNNLNVPTDSIGFSTAVLQTSFNSLGNLPIVKKGFVVHYSETTYEPTLANKLIQVDVEGDEMVTKLTGLKHNTRYSVRAFATCKVGDGEETVYSGNRNFGTKRPEETTFNNLRLDSASVNALYYTCGIAEVKDGEVIEKGFIWKERPKNNHNWHNPSFEDSSDSDTDGYTGYKAVESDSLQSYSIAITGLKPSTTYYVRSYAKVKVEEEEYVYYSNSQGYGTSSLTVNIGFEALADSCTVSGDVMTSNLPEGVEEIGICYSSNRDERIEDMKNTVKAVKAEDFDESGKWSVGLGNLEAAHEYKVGFYFILNGEEIRLDGEWWFTTKRTPSINDNVSPGKQGDE